MSARKDLTGEVFGRLTVLEYSHQDKSGNSIWKLRCNCGKETTSIITNLRNGSKRSCGCLRRDNRENIQGKKFGRLLVLEEAGSDKWYAAMWKVRCDCGKEVIVKGHSMRTGKTVSCGCYHKEIIRGGIGEAVTNKKLAGYKYSAKVRGYAWELTDEQALHLFLEPCYYCNAAPREIAKNKYSSSAKLNGIDRVDNSLGYKLDNCVPCCTSCQYNKKECSMHIAQKMVDFKNNSKV